MPRVVDPSLNVTVPVGVPAPGAVTVTVAVKVTDWPTFERIGRGDQAGRRGRLATVWVMAVEVDGALLASPP